MTVKPTKLTTHNNSDVWYVKWPISMFAHDDLTISDLRIYAALDFLAGERGWWYGEQEEILIYLADKLTEKGVATTFTNSSTSTFRRAIKKLRDKRFIITERLTMGILKYYVTARKPELPPPHRRS